MSRPAHKTEVVNRTKNVQFHFAVFSGKEKDAETGYGYFGARYMDHELMTMWLSVDPMADKYPNISPYVFCACSPVKVIDPDGCQIYLYDNCTIDKIKGYMEELFGTDCMFSFDDGWMTINKREFKKYYKKASSDQQTLLDGIKALIERPEKVTVKVQDNNNKFEFRSPSCIGAISVNCVSGFTSEKPVDCMGYLIGINDRGLDQQINYTTDLYTLEGSNEDRLYPLTTRTTAASTFIHESLDELLNRNLQNNVSIKSDAKDKVIYQNVAQRILKYHERDGIDHSY